MIEENPDFFSKFTVVVACELTEDATAKASAVMLGLVHSSWKPANLKPRQITILFSHWRALLD